MCSVHRGIFSTSGVFITSGVFSTLGEYHEYIGGVMYIGGYHECIGEGDIMNTLGDVQYIGGYHDACRALPHQFLSELDNFYQNDPERSWYTSFQHWYCQNGVRYFSTKFLMRATNVTVTVF